MRSVDVIDIDRRAAEILSELPGVVNIESEGFADGVIRINCVNEVALDSLIKLLDSGNVLFTEYHIVEVLPS